MSIFGTKMKALSGLKGIAAEEITEEQLVAVNDELTANGINVSVSRNVEGKEDEQEKELQTAKDAVVQLTSDLDAANAEIQTLKHENTQLKNPAGEEHTETSEKEDKVETAGVESKDFDFDQSASAKALRENGLI